MFASIHTLAWPKLSTRRVHLAVGIAKPFNLFLLIHVSLLNAFSARFLITMQLYPLFLLLPFISAFPTDKPHAHSQQHRRACALPALNDTTFPGITLGNVTSAIDIGGSRFDYGNTKIRGVNLGGVSEPGISCGPY